jgi:hypothetical protein
MSTSSPVVREFFERYERSRNTFDLDVIDSQYPDAFMMAGPDGARVAEKQAALAGLPKGQALFKSVGHTSTTLVSLEETRLDEYYAMAHARFVWRFEKAPAPPNDADVDSTFILYIRDGVAKIVFQHEHEDFLQALRARGVLAAKP